MIKELIKIAQKLDSLAKSDYNGILVAHGTDTMQYTAAFLSFALAGFPKPIVLQIHLVFTVLEATQQLHYLYSQMTW